MQGAHRCGGIWKRRGHARLEGAPLEQGHTRQAFYYIMIFGGRQLFASRQSGNFPGRRSSCCRGVGWQTRKHSAIAPRFLRVLRAAVVSLFFS